MTFTISKTKLAIAITAVVMLIPATALATHVFDDVPDDKFFAAPVEWAFDNGITTGTSATTFHPERSVTRGESVTFLKRYNDNIVEPADEALQDGIDANATDIATNASDIAALTANECSGTVTGFRVYDHSAVIDNEDWFVDVQLPCVAPTPLTSLDVNFHVNALASDDDATCTGTAAEPTAPAGKVCLYVSGSGGVDDLTGFDSLMDGTTFDSRGFSIRGRANTAPGGDTYARITWAYTPPAAMAGPAAASADSGSESDGK